MKPADLMKKFRSDPFPMVPPRPKWFKEAVRDLKTLVVTETSDQGRTGVILDVYFRYNTIVADVRFMTGEREEVDLDDLTLTFENQPGPAPVRV